MTEAIRVMVSLDTTFPAFQCRGGVAARLAGSPRRHGYPLEDDHPHRRQKIVFENEPVKVGLYLGKQVGTRFVGEIEYPLYKLTQLVSTNEHTTNYYTSLRRAGVSVADTIDVISKMKKGDYFLELAKLFPGKFNC